MKTYLKLLAVITLIGFMLIGCKGDTGPAGPAGSAGFSLSGRLYGYVNLYDYNGNPIENKSSVTVAAEEAGIVAMTDSLGRFILNGLTTGIYTISFSKPGYGVYRERGVQFVGGGDACYGTAWLYGIAMYVVTDLVATTSPGKVSVVGKLSGVLPKPDNRQPILFISTSQNVSSDPHNYIFSLGSRATDSLTTIITTEHFNKYSIRSGETVYIVAYGGTLYTMSYADFATGRYFSPTLNPTPSNIVSVVVP